MTKYMVLRGYDPEMARLHGKKKTALDRLIGLRSWLAHSESEYSDRVRFADCDGSVSMSATKRDGCNCHRAKPIKYTHLERWRNVYIPVTFEQEVKMVIKDCEMSDISYDIDWNNKVITITSPQQPNGCYYGPNALPYDTPAVALGFISKVRFWKVRKNWTFCSMSRAIALMEVWPELLEFMSSAKVAKNKTGTEFHYRDIARLNPDQVHPALLDSICRCKFNERI